MIDGYVHRYVLTYNDEHAKCVEPNFINLLRPFCKLIAVACAKCEVFNDLDSVKVSSHLHMELEQRP